jgi:hypothetical protein
VKAWVIPPKQNAAFVADMERVLDLYAEPYDPARPVVCFDERPCALVGEVEGRPPLPMRPGAEVRQDHEYVRGGLCCAMLAFEPLTAYRRAWVLPQRRRVEFASVVRELCDEVYPEAERIRLVCDQLNTHSVASFYEAFAPAEARRLAARVEFVHTPVHGGIVRDPGGSMWWSASSQRWYGSASGGDGSAPSVRCAGRSRRGWALGTRRGLRWSGSSRRRMHG